MNLSCGPKDRKKKLHQINSGLLIPNFHANLLLLKKLDHAAYVTFICKGELFLGLVIHCTNTC